MKRHDFEDDDLPGSAAELARGWLDANHLQLVKVEVTDLGDHYDPVAKAVRLSRGRFERKSLTAATTAAHEVSHALQDAAGYGPFVWRTRFAHLAQILGQAGTVVLLSVPAAALFTHSPIPPLLIGSTLVVMLGSGLALQIAALQSELDASFNRALPILRDGSVRPDQLGDARRILIACSLTYVASSILSVLNFWPWLGRRGLRAQLTHSRPVALQAPSPERDASRRKSAASQTIRPGPRRPGRAQASLLRRLGKPLIRSWFRYKMRLA